MENVDDLWEKACTAFPILKHEEPVFSRSCSNEQFDAIIKELQESGYHYMVFELVFTGIEDKFRTWVASKFWDHFQPGATEFDGFNKFKTAVSYLMRYYWQAFALIRDLDQLALGFYEKPSVLGYDDLNKALKSIIRASLHSQLPSFNYQLVIEDFYRLSYKVFSQMDKHHKNEFNESGDDNMLQCNGCSAEMDQCRCKAIVDEFFVINKLLLHLELLERLAGEVITQLIHRQIKSHVKDTCFGSFDQSYIHSLEEVREPYDFHKTSITVITWFQWLNSVVVEWLMRLYSSSIDCPEIKKTVDTFKDKLDHLLFETYTKTRIEQLFNIIIDYPDSDPAIEDLRICLEKTDLRGHLTTRLQQTLEARLLHPGVNTPDIITGYVASIRALRQLDPSGVLLETVTKPVRQYLRCREDTMRCVVMSLTGEGSGELGDELVRGDEVQDDDDSDQAWDQWQPDPADAQSPKTGRGRQSWDIISMLVNVYGSKEMFVNEYRTLLADRLLTQFSFSTEKEIRYLELLKLRFGDSVLHHCEVMLKDIYDSKRINHHLYTDSNFCSEQEDVPCTALILSAEFWPKVKVEGETLELPPPIKNQLKLYTKAFETLKGNRTLNWKPHLGLVTMDVELKNRTLTLSVSPTQAAIIWYFQDKSQWTIEELSSVLVVPPTLLRRRIAFWQSQGLLKEMSPDTFVLVEESPSTKTARPPPPPEMLCEDESESVMASAQDQREEELQVFWSYIVGMLTNLDTLPLERIHQMLKMFASQSPSSAECTLQQLRQFLDRKVREHKLLFSGGLYHLPK